MIHIDTRVLDEEGLLAELMDDVAPYLPYISPISPHISIYLPHISLTR